MKFEVEHKEYIKVDISDSDILKGAAKVLMKRLSKELKEYEGFYLKDGKLVGVYDDYYGSHSSTTRDVLEEKFPGMSMQDEELILLIIGIRHESVLNPS